MLLLARRTGQTIVIDGNIRLTVHSVRGQIVRLRIDAPKEIRVDREEVSDRRGMESRTLANCSADESRHNTLSEEAPLASQS